mgnify:CR=1 FL=1
MRAEDMIATHPDVRGNTATLLVAAVDEVAACALTCTVRNQTCAYALRCVRNPSDGITGGVG